jgi:hypothetical protein
MVSDIPGMTVSVPYLSRASPVCVPIQSVPSRAGRSDEITLDGSAAPGGGTQGVNRMPSNVSRPLSVPIHNIPSGVWAIAYGIAGILPSPFRHVLCPYCESRNDGSSASTGDGSKAIATAQTRGQAFTMSELQEAAPHGDGHRVRPIVGAQFVDQVLDVEIHGRLRDGEPIGDLLVAMAVTNQAQHLQLARG